MNVRDFFERSIIKHTGFELRRIIDRFTVNCDRFIFYFLIMLIFI